MSAFKDMCETIVEAEILTNPETGKSPTAEEIFNYSSSGELFMIFEWYAIARDVLDNPELNGEGK